MFTRNHNSSFFSPLWRPPFRRWRSLLFCLKRRDTMFVQRIKHYDIFTVSKYPGFTVRNNKGDFKNHIHLRNLRDCRRVIAWCENRLIPKSAFFRESCRRLSTDKYYQQRLIHHKDKDAYYNPNKGVRK